MIWIIGGTSEGRMILERIKDLDNYIVTVATDGGKDFIDNERLVIGRMSYEKMVEFGNTHNISLIVDLTHPYAKIVSENAKKVAKELNISYTRYVRAKMEEDKNSIYVNSYEEAYEYLSKITGTVFFTTGSKNIGDFEKVRGDNKFIYRVLPALESIQICVSHNIHMRDIVAVIGPFSKEYNRIMLKEHNAKYCLMKDSGKQGGTLEKVQACKELGVIPIIIGRDYEEGFNNLDLVEKAIRKEHSRLEG